MKTLVLTTRLFDQPRSGGEHCSARLLGHLQALGHDLHIVGRGPLPTTCSQHGPRFSSLGPRVEAQTTVAMATRWRSLAAALLHRRAWTVHRTLADGAAQRARWLLSSECLQDCALIVVDHLLAWSWLEALPAAQRHRLPPVLLLMHNIESAVYAVATAATPQPAALRGLLAREARLVQRMEHRALAKAAAVACLSAADADVLRAQAPARRHFEVLPGHGPLHATSTPSPVPHGPRRRVGLIGSWSWAANRRGLDWVLSQVLPHLPAHVELVIAGHGLPPLPPHPQLRALGAVVETHSFYAQIDVIALAALDGSGVQEKAIEALMQPHAVVATRHALRGLAPWPDGVAVADEGPAFAHACATLPLPGRSASAARAWSLARAQTYRAALQRAVAVAQSG